MMHDIVIAAQLWILVFDCVEAVWAGSNNSTMFSCIRTMAVMACMSIFLPSKVEPVVIECLDILLSLRLPQVLVTDAACRITGTGLFGTKNRIIDLCRLQNFCHCGGNLLVTQVE